MPIESAQTTETQVEVEGFTIRVQIAGEGPAVVVIHGAGGISDAKGLELLAEKHRTYAIELPGFGGSAPNDSTQSMRELAHTVAAVIEKLELDSFAVVATSVGARLALWLAVDGGSGLESLVLVSPASILPEGVQVPTIWPALLVKSVGTGQSSPLHVISPMAASQEERLLKKIFGPDRDAELEQAMKSLKIPTLVLFGDEDYQVPSETGRIYRELLPKSYYILVHKAGPLIAYERPEAFASVVLDFLEWRDQFVYSHTTRVLNP